jgi:IS5 family transposase
MKQMSLGESGYERKTKRTRKREFLDEMNLVVPWAELVSLIAPHAPAAGAKGGRPPFAVETMLRIHFLQQWFNLSDPAMEEALYDTPMFREFAGLDMGEDNLPDESTILRFRHLLEKNNLSLQLLATVNATLTAKGLMLKSGTVVDATLGLVHTVIGTAANVNDVTQASALVHGEESDVFADAGYQGVSKREETQDIDANWHVAMRPGKRKALDRSTPMGAVMDKLEHVKASIRAKVEHPFRVIKRQFGHVKVRYRGLAKNTAQLHTLFALSNLWMARRTLLREARG